MTRRRYARRRRIKFYSTLRLTVFISLLMIGAFMAGGFLFNENVSGAGEPQFESVRIKAGDTVWGIARDYGPANGDTRTLVEAICDLNEIDPGRIYPGQTIMVPIYENA